MGKIYELYGPDERRIDNLKRRIKDSKQYDSLVQRVEFQQKEFIEYLESEIKSCELVCDLTFNHNKEMKVYKEVLEKYKEIIGGLDEQ